MNDMALAFPPELLKRQAVIYVRQSTQSQVMTNLESQRRQYDLVEMARGYGFAGIDVIDDDLGDQASGCQARPASNGSSPCLFGVDRRGLLPGSVASGPQWRDCTICWSFAAW
ncbi:recombinase family protein [Paracoccus aerodenitrificans]|uniref:recombinase family protein n=1 Tax=Paracoccus aerodenitrificans TaxID=3017781 RepID=UPI0022F10BAB|nr:recombinase family protein [Paracoccus aerodenitrificans]WBU64741.1 recombinase family protein [Paracoccus aerodenitrificans]